MSDEMNNHNDTMTRLTLPTIHMNGTSASDLLDGLMEASAAVRSAISAVQRNGPNGRDYYPQGPNAMSAAIREHEARLEKLTAVRYELEVIAEYVADQRKA